LSNQITCLPAIGREELDEEARFALGIAGRVLVVRDLLVRVVRLLMMALHDPLVPTRRAEPRPYNKSLSK
jgi:hypothetical protein